MLEELHNDPSIEHALCAQPLYKTADVRHRGTKASKICLMRCGLSHLIDLLMALLVA